MGKALFVGVVLLANAAVGIGALAWVLRRWPDDEEHDEHYPYSHHHSGGF